MNLRFGSVFSGIEAASVAWNPLGWKAAFVAEIDRFPSTVLAHHYSTVPNMGDMTQIKGDEYGSIDVLVGGSPCQDFSVAGLRAGMDGKRGQLTIEYARLAHRARSRWMVWENVPGVLSIDGGKAFALFLSALCGRDIRVPAGGWQNGGIIAGDPSSYGLAYRVLDAQHFGVPQRRRRVFVVGHLGDWRRAAAVLLEFESLCGNPAPRREAGKVAPTIPARRLGGGGLGTDFDCDGGTIAVQTCPTLCSEGNRTGGDRPPGTDVDTADSLVVTHSLRGERFDASEDGTGRGTPLIPVAHVATLPTMQNGADTPTGHNARSGDTKDSYIVPMVLAIRGRQGESMLEVREDGLANAVLTPNGGRAGIGVGAIAFAQNTRDEVRLFGGDGSIAGALAAEPGAKQQTYIAKHMVVRRLTPEECEALQGFPRDYTKISEKTADGPRYKALGNSMAVPVMAWIGKRIELVEAIA